MPDRTYIHGYSSEEQQRLVKQAHYWHELLGLGDLNYRQGESLLEIGCAAGATLGVLGTAFPGVKLAGIDLETRQIEFARRHLAGLGLSDVDLRVGDARQLPWPEQTFDHVYIMWLLEHVDEADAEAILRQAFRVLTKDRDRKSTRLNSSHVAISYAVFCLKKKKHMRDVGRFPATV